MTAVAQSSWYTLHQFSAVPIDAPLTRVEGHDTVSEREAAWWTNLDPAAMNLFGISVSTDDSEVGRPAVLASRRWSPGDPASSPSLPDHLDTGTGRTVDRLIDTDLLNRLQVKHDDWVVTSIISRPERRDQAGYFFYYYYDRSPRSDLYLHELSINRTNFALLHLAREVEGEVEGEVEVEGEGEVEGEVKVEVDVPSPIVGSDRLARWNRDATLLAGAARRIIANLSSAPPFGDHLPDMIDGTTPLSFSVLQLPIKASDKPDELVPDMLGFERVMIQVDTENTAWLLIGEATHMLITKHPEQMETTGLARDELVDEPRGLRLVSVESLTGPTEWMITTELVLQSLWDTTLELRYRMNIPEPVTQNAS